LSQNHFELNRHLNLKLYKMDTSFKFLFIFLFLGIGSFSWGQAVTPPPGNSLTPSTKTPKVVSPMDSINSALRIRDVDKMYQISVWRRIDLRERFNLPFAGSGNKKNGIIQNLYNAVGDSLQAFSDENLENELDLDGFKNAFWFRSEDNDGDGKLDSIIGPDEFVFIDLKEDFVFDRHHSQFKFDVKYISIVMDKESNMPKEFEKDSTSTNLREKVVAYFRYNDFINYFKKHTTARWINFENISESKPYPEAFEMRNFRSVVTRVTNEYDFSLATIANQRYSKLSPDDQLKYGAGWPKLQAFLDAMAFEYKLLDLESSVWEW